MNPDAALPTVPDPGWSRACLSYEEHGYAAFHLRGDDPGVNKYNPLPRFQPGKHMPFRDMEDWQ